MNFPDALAMVQNGMRARRAGWQHARAHGLPLFIYLVAGSQFTVNRAPLNAIYDEGTRVNYLPHIDAAYRPDADNIYTCGVWSPTGEDLMATDWQTLEAVAVKPQTESDSEPPFPARRAAPFVEYGRHPSQGLSTATIENLGR